MKFKLQCFFILMLTVTPFAKVEAQSDCSTNGLLVDVKTSSKATYNQYNTRTICQLPGFYENEKNVSVNIYGSRTDKRTTATGYYFTQLIDGRWWVIDPDGYLSICRAVNAISQGTGNTSKSTFFTKFSNNTNTWLNETKTLLNDNGFYGAGAWSSTSSITSNPNQSSKPLAYTIILNWMSGFGATRTYQQSGHMGYPNDAIFVFEAGFAAYCETKAKALTANKTDKNIFGYFSDNELPFYNNSLNNFLRLGKTSMKDENYLATKKWLTENGYNESDTINSEIQRKFLGYVAETYFSIVYNTIKKYDPNHMVLGPRVNVKEARENQYFMQAAGKYVDILAVNYYGVWTPDKASNINWGKNLGKPFIVTEFYTKGDDAGLANTSGAGWIVKTQLDRGYAYQNYCLALLESKYCVGWHWFKYMDNDPSIPDSEPSNIDANKGIVNIAYEPYSDLIDKMRELNVRVYNLIDYFDQPQNIISIYPEADAYYKGPLNYGTDDRLGIKNSTDLNVREAFLRFDLTGLDKNIQSANLHLAVLRAGDPGITYKADFVSDDNWTENSITQSLHPIGTYEIGRWAHGSNVTLDVSKPLKQTIDSDKKLSIKLSAVNTVVSQLEYGSRENSVESLRPRIDIKQVQSNSDSRIIDIFIDDKFLPFFNSDTLNYTILLASGTKVNPTIAYTLTSMQSTAVLINPLNILSSSVSDRTATIFTTSADGTTHKTYSLIFKIADGSTELSNVNSTSDFQFTPNPIAVNSNLTIFCVGTYMNNNVVSITDLQGKLLLRNSFSGAEVSVNLHGLNKGLYIVTLENANFLKTNKILII